MAFVGRHRWVEYAKKDRYDASQVPPEWQGWLHFITDHTGDEFLMLKPKRYGLSTRKTYLERGVNLSTILKDMHLILVRESGLGINHGNPRNLSNLPKPIFFFFLTLQTLGTSLYSFFFF
ncbi:hypothetical protein E1A91_D05G082300v1 [Gossypium mustelinum]|uniref:NADH dehydrogenase [ubiquinone] 1 alpha subcomplex subunit 12 n=1 Tax=Gossypium mustelinum TaxID=34275 RepID=A0A5D2URM7_GOSMU|nr:hypothetical protein E1A91_D05G082300v1 [Gossypium mustelinum]